MIAQNKHGDSVDIAECRKNTFMSDVTSRNNHKKKKNFHSVEKVEHVDNRFF